MKGNSEHQDSDSGHGEKRQAQKYLDGVTDGNLIKLEKEAW